MKLECGVHPDGRSCTCTMIDTPAPVDLPSASQSTLLEAAAVLTIPDDDDNMGDDDEDELGDIDDGEVYAAMRVGPDAVPQRRPRLRLRKLDEHDAACTLSERLAATLAAKIDDSSDWKEAEGYITTLPYTLYDRFQPYVQAQHRDQPPPKQHDQHPDQRQPEVVQCAGGTRSRRRRGRSGGGKAKWRMHPPRVTHHHREHRLDEALDLLHTIGRTDPVIGRLLPR